MKARRTTSPNLEHDSSPPIVGICQRWFHAWSLVFEQEPTNLFTIREIYCISRDLCYCSTCYCRWFPMSKVIQNMVHGPNFHLTRIPIRPISGLIDFTRLNNPRAGHPEEKMWRVLTSLVGVTNHRNGHDRPWIFGTFGKFFLVDVCIEGR